VLYWATFDQLGGVGPGPLARNSRKVANQLSPTSIFSRTIPPPTSNCNITNCLLTHAQPTNQRPPWWKSPSSYLRLLSVCCLALPSRVGLLCIGQQSKNSATSLVPNHAGRAFQEPFTNTADHFRPVSRAVAPSCSNVIPSSAVPQVFLPPPGHHRLDCFWYTTKISVEGPIRQTWPNKHHSCCQLGDSPLQLSLQVALTYSLDKTSGSREGRFSPTRRNPYMPARWA